MCVDRDRGGRQGRKEGSRERGSAHVVLSRHWINSSDVTIGTSTN